ncbi:EAL domain-containing protein [Caldichromatium japonicum]|uniref:cyclic-guanylate-specific phosphodiesterase n=1 Tax=Caldichromatium japonicum TaxID=2699430 RepID=A0A6G7VCG3_9GAMM|nr:EAL domain-containing protein [Caldichromatium japonicum]QIK37566.1 EAL domain-containing protein [Caldichromatium japonicum]
MTLAGSHAGLAFAQILIDELIEAVWLVDPQNACLIAVNRAALDLFGLCREKLVGRHVTELVYTPEDLFFWEDALSGRAETLLSKTLIRRQDATLVEVLRRVGRLNWGAEGEFYLVCFFDQSERYAAENELEKLVSELRATLESSADGILVTDLHGAIRSFNRRFAELWELPNELLTERNDSAIYDWMLAKVKNAEDYARRLAEIASDPLVKSTDMLIFRSGRVLERTTVPQYSRGCPIGRVYSFTDITQRLKHEQELRLAAQVFASSLDAILITDPELHILTLNPAASQLIGQDSASLIGQRIDQILQLWSGSAAESEICRLLEQTAHWQGELNYRHPDGRELVCLASLVRVMDAVGSVAHYLVFVKDLSEVVAARQYIERLAFNDSLTGLPNRRRLDERLEFNIQLAQRAKSSFAVLFVDLDRFKHINDSMGHLFGDRVLIKVAERIAQCLRHVDTVVRLGGDEFVLILHRVDTNETEQIARRLLESVAKPFSIDGFEFTLSCSIGIAMYPEDGETADELIKNADTAMYYIKERGRNGLCFYRRQMNLHLLERVRLDHAMREALLRRHFWLAYQPQVNLKDGRIKGAEALLRWSDPDLGNLSPAHFIPIAEESGFIVALGDWVLQQAITQAARWYCEGLRLLVSVNVSAAQFQQPDFSERLARYLAEANLPPDLLELELTESILIQNIEETLERLQILVGLGVRLAIDDFGTGYSNLAYLKRFPIHRLKIDRSFVSDIPNDESDTVIATAVISLAKALNLQVIAEGVENETQRQFLLEAGCHAFQGYLCAPALRPEQLEALIMRLGLDEPSAD